MTTVRLIRAVVAHSAPRPAASARRLGVLMVQNAYDGGAGQVSGSVSNIGLPNQPVYRRVRLHEQRTGRLVREAWSDPVTGAYAFSGIRPDRKYYVAAFDHTGLYGGVIETDITPEAMP